MAKKGTKFQKYTPDFKVKVVNEYLSGEGGAHSLARKHNIPKESTIWNWIKKYHKEGFEGFYVDLRGKSSIDKPKVIKVDYDSMTKDEKIAYLEMEVAILKKLKEIQKKKPK
ncbi:transposase [Mycoplasmatota bacterium zrk1]